MNIAKYFWDLKEGALREVRKTIKDPRHPLFNKRMVTLLSRCDRPKELFSVISKKMFIEVWPGVRTHWIKITRRSEFRDWWETIYEQLTKSFYERPKRKNGSVSVRFRRIGIMIKEARIDIELSQKQLASRIGMKQPDISNIEEGKKNITLYTLMRICKILEIKRIDIG